MAGMNIQLQPGRYIVAVSGGVDSVVLLHVLQQIQQESPDVSLVVAHVDHGIRPDSAEDLRHVESLARDYGLPFESTSLQLGPTASEEIARVARYDFLEKVQQKHEADAIITAHHQDDVIETAFLNLLRGTHRKGLTSLASTASRKRPLLHTPKKRIVSYARANGLVWREDSTNADTTYARNAVRHRIVKQMTPLQRQHMLAYITHTRQLNDMIDSELANLLHVQSGLDVIDRRMMNQLPFAISVEVLAAWLRRAGVRGFDRRGLARIVTAIKTYTPGRRIDVNKNFYIDVNSRSLALVQRDC